LRKRIWNVTQIASTQPYGFEPHAHNRLVGTLMTSPTKRTPTSKRSRREPHAVSSYPLSVLSVSFLLFLAGCGAPAVAPPQATAAAPGTPTATFPIPTSIPTQTPTPASTSTPRADLATFIDLLLFRDTFETDRGWQLGTTAIGGASLVKGRYSLAVREPYTMFVAQAPFRETDNFVLKVKLRLEVCGEGDEYGVMFRMNDFREHFRFALNCEGAARVSRILESGEAALLPITQTYTTLPGTMVDNHLAIVADGPRLRFFINEIEVFATRDEALTSGKFGLFVRSRASGQTSASFDDFEIYSLEPGPMPTPTP
jgi:hypothetical protein